MQALDTNSHPGHLSRPPPQQNVEGLEEDWKILLLSKLCPVHQPRWKTSVFQNSSTIAGSQPRNPMLLFSGSMTKDDLNAPACVYYSALLKNLIHQETHYWCPAAALKMTVFNQAWSPHSRSPERQYVWTEIPKSSSFRNKNCVTYRFRL